MVLEYWTVTPSIECHANNVFFYGCPLKCHLKVSIGYQKGWLNNVSYVLNRLKITNIKIKYN